METFNVESSLEFELLVRDLTDSGISRKEAEKTVKTWMAGLVA